MCWSEGGNKICVDLIKKEEQALQRKRKRAYFSKLPYDAHIKYANSLNKRYSKLNENQKRKWHRLYMEAVRHNKISYK